MLRTPSLRDAAAVWRLVRDSEVLDLNSPYAYLLLCSDFAETSIVAEAAGHLLGFVAAYRRPPRPESVFVWQIVAAREAQRQGLASHLIGALLAQRACRGVRFLEATVTPSNHPSRAFFEGFARRLAVPFEEKPAFPAELFPDTDHEAELRVRIGPLDVSRSTPEEP